MSVRVLSIQTTLLGNRVYGKLLRTLLAGSRAIEFDASWSTEAHDARALSGIERQLDRLFLKMVRLPAIRRRNLDFFPLRFELGTSYWARRTLRERLKRQEPDVLHVHTQALAFLIQDVMKRIPTVVSADGTSFQMAEQQLPRAWRWTFLGNHLLERRTFRRAAAVVTFSRWAADSVVRRHGVARDRVHVIPPGVDLSLFAPVDRSGDAAGMPLRILFVGGEFERKGGPLLVDAFLEEFATDEHVVLDVVTQSGEVRSHPRVVVHRGVDAYSDAWYERYREAGIFVMPTRRDQSPSVYLEAMAAGLPVIATPVGSTSEVVEEGVTGYIVPVGDSMKLRSRMRALAGDSSLRERFGAAARARVESDYDARVNAGLLERLFLHLARPSTGGAGRPRSQAQE